LADPPAIVLDGGQAALCPAAQAANSRVDSPLPNSTIERGRQLLERDREEPERVGWRA